jgi:hypothetical protein
MKTQHLIILLLIINLAGWLYLAIGRNLATAQTNTPASAGIAPLVRARAIELVDSKGTRRALLSAEENGETVLRLIDAKGTIRVKLGASENGSGLVLLNDATEPGIHALAKDKGTTLTLVNKDGRKRVLAP